MKSQETIKLAIVVPCFNEKDVLLETDCQLNRVIEELISSHYISSNSLIYYVNDGSNDSTWEIINALHEKNPRSCGVNLAANVGHQNALMVGLYIASRTVDIMVTIDADLQDDVNAIVEMVAQYNQGNDIVYGVRSRRDTDTFFKRFTAESFYRFMHSMGVKTIYNHADFRLMSKRAVLQLLSYSERNLFIRGIVPLIGYKTSSVYYERHERFAGESKYPLRKMLSFAMDGITSFSIKPVHLITWLGVFFIIISLFILIWVAISYIGGNIVPGWTSLILSIWFCFGCILVSIGLVGEYIGKIYIEVKQRPRYNIETVLE